MHKPHSSLLILSLPVRIVKHKFLHDGKDSQLRQGPVEGGQLRATGLSFPAHQVVSYHHHGPGDTYPVEDDTLQCMAQLNRIHLDGGRFWKTKKMSNVDIITEICKQHFCGNTYFTWQFKTWVTQERSGSLMRQQGVGGLSRGMESYAVMNSHGMWQIWIYP